MTLRGEIAYKLGTMRLPRCAWLAVLSLLALAPLAMMGHKDIRTTLRYLKIYTEGKREAIENLPIKLVPDEN